MKTSSDRFIQVKKGLVADRVTLQERYFFNTLLSIVQRNAEVEPWGFFILLYWLLICCSYYCFASTVFAVILIV